MAIFSTYVQKGTKLSFANWISNISPEETPFSSAIGKESTTQKEFKWQVDSLTKATENNAVPEGSDAGDATMTPTMEISNLAQILRKVVIVSDTANATDNYGRGRELMYQLEKAGAELKRDLESSFLKNGVATIGTAVSGIPGATTGGTARKTGGFQALVGYTSGTGGALTVNTGTHTGTAPDPDSGAVVVATAKAAPAAGEDFIFTEDELFDLTAQLFLAGAKANTIMVHPRHAKKFSKLQEKDATGGAVRARYFENTKEINLFVNSIIDPLGQKFSVVFNRLMPENAVYIFNPEDWKQKVLRAPAREQLAKTGSAEKWQIECEIGLEHRNPCASAVLKLLPHA